MKKSLLALAVLGAFAGTASAQSSVTIYGIVDSAVRMTTNAGATAANKDESITALVPGGMSQSRLGFNINEDLGGGLRAIANMEHRFASDTGVQGSLPSANDFWRQSWVGLQSSSFGRITMGRQYNVLFDAYTGTYSSFKYSPYIEAFKPEIGLSLGARNDNAIKYAITVGGFTGEALYAFGEGAATAPGGNGKSYGGMLKYAFGPFAVAGAYQELEDGPATQKTVKAYTIGGAFTSGPLYVNLSWGRNDFEAGFSTALNSALLTGAITQSVAIQGGASSAADKRDILMTGLTYQVTPGLNLGGQYWRIEQDGLAANGAADGKADAFAFVADYAFSKRTDAYFEVDYTKLGDKLMYTNTATDRTGIMVGLRHRF
ncbi:porin [Sphaerotilaceae bacterium SBD11-9]